MTRMDEIFEMTDEELAHIVRAASLAAQEELKEKARKWILDNSDLATSQSLCWMNNSNPGELLEILK